MDRLPVSRLLEEVVVVRVGVVEKEAWCLVVPLLGWDVGFMWGRGAGLSNDSVA